MVKFEYNGVTYPNAVELARNITLMTSVLVGWYEGAEILCANAGAMCYDTDVRATEDDPIGKIGKRIVKSCQESGHNTVLEHGSATFVKKVPIFVARQDLRSRHASFDERSLRYCRADNGDLTYYLPNYLELSHIKKVKDSGKVKEAEFLLDMRQDWIVQHENAIRTYSKYTDEQLNEMWDSLGMNGERVRETVRAVLPLGIMTMYMDTRNIWSWIHHSEKRLCLRAQDEIGSVRRQEVKQLREVFPVIFDTVNKPCSTSKGCPEHRPCGLVKLYPGTKYDYATAKRLGYMNNSESIED